MKLNTYLLDYLGIGELENYTQYKLCDTILIYNRLIVIVVQIFLTIA